jgi:hypothetical protein
MTDTDFMAGNWWTTVSGAGTEDVSLSSWADDYTRHRTGREATYSGVDTLIGRSKTGRELDMGKY